MVMAEEHGMYKGFAPGERASEVKNNGGLLRKGCASLRCQRSNRKDVSTDKLVFSRLFPLFYHIRVTHII